MRYVCGFAILGLGFGLLSFAVAQAPKDDKANSPAVKNIVDRLMAFDKNNDGKLSKDEIGDRRLLRLFARADADKDGEVTKEELTAMAMRLIEETNGPRGGPGGPGRGGPIGFGPPPPGQILPSFLQDRLKLTAKQKKQLDDLQKEIDSKLNKILTAEQKKQLKEMREGFGRGGPPGGPLGRAPGDLGPPGGSLGRAPGDLPPDDGNSRPRPPQ